LQLEEAAHKARIRLDTIRAQEHYAKLSVDWDLFDRFDGFDGV
jgi:hypothetical protein